MSGQVPFHLRDCERCGGAGKLSYETEELAADGSVIGHTYGTRACACVRDLPPVAGNASWWESETVWSRVFNDGIYRDSVAEFTVSAEVPRDNTGRRVVMRGNRYYPTWLTVDWPDRMLLHPEQARELALVLLAGAEACESVDGPCADECGHWWPCDFCKGERPEIEF